MKKFKKKGFFWKKQLHLIQKETTIILRNEEIEGKYYYEIIWNTSDSVN